eukprot:jgi/Tetstr1/433110/TSEL_022442.t1
MLAGLSQRGAGGACVLLHRAAHLAPAGLATLAPALTTASTRLAALSADALPSTPASAFDAGSSLHSRRGDRRDVMAASSICRATYRHLNTTCPAGKAVADLNLPVREADPSQPDTPAAHPGSPSKGPTDEKSYLLMHPVYTKEYVESVAPRHKPPKKIHEYVAYGAIQTVRSAFDLATGYGPDKMTADKWMTRTIFLETVAGVPGMVAGMLRHMNSLRGMKRDHGWIHTLLEEAENERMHLLTFLQMRQPGPFFRGMVLLGQGVMFNAYMLLYILFPKTCHSAVGYLEEEAVKTYTHLAEDLKAAKIPEWHEKEAPQIAKMYWRLEEGSTILDMILAIRADEACHSHVNHTLSELNSDDTNPFAAGSHQVP